MHLKINKEFTFFSFIDQVSDLVIGFFEGSCDFGEDFLLQILKGVVKVDFFSEFDLCLDFIILFKNILLNSFCSINAGRDGVVHLGNERKAFDTIPIQKRQHVNCLISTKFNFTFQLEKLINF